MMSVLKSAAVGIAVLVVAGCAGSQPGSLSSSLSQATAPAAPAAADLDVLVRNTVVRVGEVANEDLLRTELEEFKSGLYWSRGNNAAEAVIEIDGKALSLKEDSQDALSSTFGETVLFGKVTLIDSATGDPLIEPIFVSVDVGTDRDEVVGLSNRSKRAVELEYLVQKFILASREALYGRGV